METSQEGNTQICIMNMVCPRCIRIIEDQFALLKLPVIDVRLRQVELARPFQAEELEQVKSMLAEYGFELLEDKKEKLVEQIKALLIDAIHHKEEKISTNFSITWPMPLARIIVP